MKTSQYNGLAIVLTALLCTAALRVEAQSLESIGKGKALSLSGGINANTVFYNASGIEGRRDPFNYFLSGNLNLSLYGWSVPMSFSYSNQQASFQQPFNQYGLSPTYKWLTLHAGYRSMTFSNYTMNGHVFLGGGVDLVPNSRLKVSAFYGRLQKAVEEDTTKENNVPIYRRMGGGAKFTFGDQKNNVGLIIFKAKDEVGSLDVPPAKSDVQPEENLVLGISFNTTLHDRISVNGEYANSAISKDTRSEAVRAGNLFDNLRFAFRPRASSSFYQALKAGFTYSFVNAGIGFAYERIDPGYRTLGAYYFNNNLESFAFTGTTVLYDKKIRLNGQVGLQRNNLDQKDLNTMSRISVSVNGNYQVSERLMFNASYSNFQTVINFRSQFDYLNQVSPYQNLDTLNYRQIAQNASFNANYVLNTSKEARQHMNVNLTTQKTSDQQADIEQPTGARFYNVNASYTLALAPQSLTVNIAGNANFTETQAAKNKIYGPSASLRRTFLKKTLSTSATVSYNNSYVNDTRTSSVTNLRLSANYTWQEKHQFDLSLTQAHRVTSSSNAPSTEMTGQRRFREVTVQLGYNYNFGTN